MGKPQPSVEPAREQLKCETCGGKTPVMHYGADRRWLCHACWTAPVSRDTSNNGIICKPSEGKSISVGYFNSRRELANKKAEWIRGREKDDNNRTQYRQVSH